MTTTTKQTPAEALAASWEAEAARYAAMGEGRSPSHRQCRTIAKVLGECAAELGQALTSARTHPTQEGRDE